MSLPASSGYVDLARGLQARSGTTLSALGKVDAVIFDVDGVLVEVSESFRMVISRTVQFYFNQILGIPGEKRFITGEETGHFKLAGRYNNDWDLAKGAVAYGLLKLAGLNGSGAVDTARLRLSGPGLEDFSAEIKRRGGGLAETLKIIAEKLNAGQYREFELRYRPDLIRQIFMEYYAGPSLCRDFYGFEPQYYRGPGLIEKERDILDHSLVRELSACGVTFGILSGRIPTEAEYLFRKTGLEHYLNRAFVVTDDGHLPAKPDPAGLGRLAERMGFRGAIYVGDVPDDWATVTAYAARYPEGPPVAGCLVRTGATSKELMSAFYEKSAVDFLAEDVNCLLSALLAVRRG